MKIGPPHGELELKIWGKKSPPTDRNCKNIAKNGKSKIFFFLNCLPMQC